MSFNFKVTVFLLSCFNLKHLLLFIRSSSGSIISIIIIVVLLFFVLFAFVELLLIECRLFWCVTTSLGNQEKYPHKWLSGNPKNWRISNRNNNTHYNTFHSE